MGVSTVDLVFQVACRQKFHLLFIDSITRMSRYNYYKFDQDGDIQDLWGIRTLAAPTGRVFGELLMQSKISFGNFFKIVLTTNLYFTERLDIDLL